jgi:hypothetical protein
MSRRVAATKSGGVSADPQPGRLFDRQLVPQAAQPPVATHDAVKLNQVR